MKIGETKVRLREAYELLRNKGLAHTQQDVADKMGSSKSTVSGAFNGNEKCLTERFITRFNEAFGNIFSLEWLLNGVGSMCCQPTSDIDSMFNVQGDNNSNVQVVGGSADAAVIALKDQEIKMLKEQVEFYKEQVEFYKSQKDA